MTEKKKPKTDEGPAESVLMKLLSKNDAVEICLIDGVEGQCLSIDDYRICGPKPWGGGTVRKMWKAIPLDILRALGLEHVT